MGCYDQSVIKHDKNISERILLEEDYEELRSAN